MRDLGKVSILKRDNTLCVAEMIMMISTVGIQRTAMVPSAQVPCVLGGNESISKCTPCL